MRKLGRALIKGTSQWHTCGWKSDTGEWVSTVFISLRTLDVKSPQTSKPHSSCSLSRRGTGEDKLILANSNTNEKTYGTNFFSQGSLLASSEEMNSKHPPQRCQPKEKDSSSKAQRVAFHCLRKLQPFRCRCSTKVVIPQLTDLKPRQRHQLVLFPGRRHNLFNTPFYDIRFFLPGTQHDFIGTQSEYFLASFFKLLCIMPSSLQKNYRVEQVYITDLRWIRAVFAGKHNHRAI